MYVCMYVPRPSVYYRPGHVSNRNELNGGELYHCEHTKIRSQKHSHGGEFFYFDCSREQPHMPGFAASRRVFWRNPRYITLSQLCSIARKVPTFLKVQAKNRCVVCTIKRCYTKIIQQKVPKHSPYYRPRCNLSDSVRKHMGRAEKSDSCKRMNAFLRAVSYHRNDKVRLRSITWPGL